MPRGTTGISFPDRRHVLLVASRTFDRMPKRNPFDDIDRLFERLNDQFADAARMSEGGVPARPGRGSAIDVEDADEAFVVTADLPGFEKGDVDVRVQDRTLSIMAERATEDADEDSTYVRRERRSESVSRRVSLPGPVDVDGVAASMTNGVLTVRLPKADSSGGHTIEVE